MKRKLLFLTALVVSVFGLKVHAQNERPVPNFSPLADDGNTIQYLYNVEAGGFLLGANDWNTRASVSETKGYQFKVANNNNGTWTLNDYVETQSEWKGVFAENVSSVWVDNLGGQGAKDWVIKTLGENKYQITNNNVPNTYLGVAASLIDSRVYMADSYLGKTWAFVNEDDYTKYLAEYEKWVQEVVPTLKSTTKKGMDITPAFGKITSSMDGWSITNPSTLHVNTWSWEGTSDGSWMTPGFMENWRSKDDNAALPEGTISYTLSGLLPNHGYKVSALVRAYNEGSTTTPQGAYFFAGNAASNDISTGIQKTIDGKALVYGVYTVTGIADEQGNLPIGLVEKDNNFNWIAMRDIQITYYGPTIASNAVALPEGGAMEAGQWYYIDILSEADYDVSAGELSKIVYTTEGTTFMEDVETINSTFDEGSNNLTANRYYIKSDVDNTFAVKSFEEVYNLGEASLNMKDGQYVVTMPTLVVKYPNTETTNINAKLDLINGKNGSASLKKGETEVATGTLSVENQALTVTFNNATLDADVENYSITIPAGVFGYNEDKTGEAVNKEIKVTFKTPAIFDGTYYLYNTQENLFLGRGAQFGTEATIDKYGVAFNLKTDVDGISSLEFVDWKDGYLYALETGGIYTDKASTGWVFAKTEGGYYLRTTDNKYTRQDDGSFGKYIHLVETDADADVWKIMTVEKRNEKLATYPTENVKTVIEKAGLDINAEDFKTFLNNCDEIPMTDVITNAQFGDDKGAWTWTQVRGENNQPKYGGFAELWQAIGNYTQTIDKSKLPAGIYKLTVDGFERRGTSGVATSLGEAGYNLVSTYLAANEEQVRLKSWYDVHTEAIEAGLSTENNYPNAPATFAECCKSEGVNTTSEIYIYLDGETDLTITLNKQNYMIDCWVIFNDFTLTRYAKTDKVEITDAKYTAYVTKFDTDFTRTDVTAYKVTDANASWVTLEEIDNAPAGEAVILYSDVNQTTEYTIYQAASAAEIGINLFMPGDGTVAGDASTIYALGNKNGAGFYLVAKDVVVPTNKGYLKLEGTPAIKGFIPFDGDATGIEVVENDNNEETVIYNLAGQRVVNPTNGIYIVNGKKVLINK